MRLEQKDSYRRTFRSQVTDVQRWDGALWAALTASTFYPTSGGQLCDKGSLNGISVVDVIIRNNHIWHCIANEENLKPGDTVKGIIDWDRRYRHMQRHTGQHLLSQAFLRVNDAFTTHSVSLRSSDCSIELGGQPQADDLELAEVLVNKTGYENLPIRAFEVEDTKVHCYQLRRPSKVKGIVRLVEMGDFEVSACGGTHVRTTAETVPIKVLKSTHIRGDQTRVTFCVGLDAIEDYSLKHSVSSSLASSFSALVPELPNRIDSLRSRLAMERRASGTLIERLARLIAKDIPRHLRVGYSTVTVHILNDDEGDLLWPLASVLTKENEGVALLAVRESTRARLLFSRSEAVDTDMNSILQSALSQIDGTGRGNSKSAQGTGVHPEKVEKALEVALAVFRQAEGSHRP